MKLTKKQLTEIINESIQKYLNESSAGITIKEYINKLEKEIQKIFPKSLASVRLHKGLMPSIVIVFGIGKDKSEWQNGILRNDPVVHKLSIFFEDISENGSLTETDLLPQVLSFDVSIGGRITIKATDGFSAYSSMKTGIRKKKGNPDQIFKHIVNYFKKLKTIWVNNLDKLDDEHYKLYGKKYK